jgi:HEAT repeat protein
MLEAARPPAPSRLRRQALFWLSQAASRRAGQGIRDAVDQDPDLDVKKQAVFALSQLPADEGVPHLIRVARTHAQREVRKRAMFWLGQSDDARALAFFEEVLSR